MRRHSKLTSWFGVAILSVAAALASANPALAVDKTITVSGDSVPSECGAAKSATMATELSGSLVGCLAIFVEHFNCRELNGFAFSTELGREEFEGTLESKPITFNTIYTFDAIWPAGSCPAPAVEAEIAGGCVHHISGEGVQGTIRFYDVIPTVGKGATNFLYEGFLTVSEDAAAAIAPVVPPAYDVAVAETVRPQGNTRLPASSC
jgi:hypothetical protein